MKIFSTLLLVFAFVSCSKSQGTFQDVSIDSFQKLKNEKPELVVLDVRTPEEIQQGKIAGAVEIDFRGNDFENKINQLDKEKPIVVYCASGNRSGKTMELMKQNGFKEVYNLQGGIKAWQQAGLPVSNE